MNESLLSEVDWGAHNPDADDPEQLTGESIQSFLTFVVQLQWLVALGRLYLHHYLVQAYGSIILISRPTLMDILSIFPGQHLIQVSIIYTHTHTHTHTHKLYISTYYYACQHKNMLHPPQEGSDRILTYGTLLDVLWLMYHTWITYGTVRRID